MLISVHMTTYFKHTCIPSYLAPSHKSFIVRSDRPRALREIIKKPPNVSERDEGARCVNVLHARPALWLNLLHIPSVGI